jgi:cold shock CspA family protein
MQVAPEIVVKGMGMSPRVDQLMTRGVNKLERVFDNIVSTRIALEREQGRHQTGYPYRMRIDIKVPGRPDVVVEHFANARKRVGDAESEAQVEVELAEDVEEAPARPVRRGTEPKRPAKEERVYGLIRRTFDSAARELQKAVDKQRAEVKTPATNRLSGVVDNLVREKGYGFIRSLEGEEVYFHRNSVLHGQWDEMKPGSGVRYVEELGEKGLQASTVELTPPLAKGELHDQVHDLPHVAELRPKNAPRRRGRQARRSAGA